MPDTWVRNAAAEALGVFTLCFHHHGHQQPERPHRTCAGARPRHRGDGGRVGARVRWALQPGHHARAAARPEDRPTDGCVLGRSAAWWGHRGRRRGTPLSREAVAIGTPTLAADVNPLVGVVLEMIATFFLVLVVYGTVVDRRAPASVYPFAIGLTIAIGILAIGAYTGGALNPRAARLSAAGGSSAFRAAPRWRWRRGRCTRMCSCRVTNPIPSSSPGGATRSDGGLGVSAVRAAAAPSMRW